MTVSRFTTPVRNREAPKMYLPTGGFIVPKAPNRGSLQVSWLQSHSMKNFWK